MRNDAPSQTISMLTLPFYTRLYFNCYFLWWELEKQQRVRECPLNWTCCKGQEEEESEGKMKSFFIWSPTVQSSGRRAMARFMQQQRQQECCTVSRTNTRDLWGTQRSALLAPAVSSKFVDVSNSMIYDLKRSINLRWLFDPMLHWSLDDLVL